MKKKTNGILATIQELLSVYVIAILLIGFVLFQSRLEEGIGSSPFLGIFFMFYLWELFKLTGQIGKRIRNTKQVFLLRMKYSEYGLLVLLLILTIYFFNFSGRPLMYWEIGGVLLLFLIEFVRLYLIIRYDLNRLVLTNKELIYINRHTHKIKLDEHLIINHKTTGKLKFYNKEKTQIIATNRFQNQDVETLLQSLSEYRLIN